MSGDIQVKSDLFKDVKYCLVDDVKDYDKVKKLLQDGGGKRFNYLSDIVTHVIADNPDSPDVSEAFELFEKPVVTGRWVISSAQCGVLLPINGFSPSVDQLFSDIVACPTQLSPADVSSIWAMITYYGGKVQLELDCCCTHLVAAKPSGAKYDRALQTQDQIKIVTPDWVVDSVKNKMLCDEDLYHPRLLILPETEISKQQELLNVSSVAAPLTPSSISINKSSPLGLDHPTSSPITSLPMHFSTRTVRIPMTHDNRFQGNITPEIARRIMAEKMESQTSLPSSQETGNIVKTAFITEQQHQQQQLYIQKQVLQQQSLQQNADQKLTLQQQQHLQVQQPLRQPQQQSPQVLTQQRLQILMY